MDRRNFLKFSTNCIVTGTAISVLSSHTLNNPSENIASYKPGVIRPPGSIAEKEFLSKCIRCNLCQDACPDNVIKLAGPNDPVSLNTPFLTLEEKGCRLCLECTKSCPTGAIRPIKEKKDVSMGLAVVDPLTCVSHNGTGVCGACHTACPFKNKAIKQSFRNAPTVDKDHCVGCGMCEEACILKGTKAIRVFSDRRLS